MKRLRPEVVRALRYQIVLAVLKLGHASSPQPRHYLSIRVFQELLVQSLHRPTALLLLDGDNELINVVLVEGEVLADGGGQLRCKLIDRNDALLILTAGAGLLRAHIP